MEMNYIFHLCLKSLVLQFALARSSDSFKAVILSMNDPFMELLLMSSIDIAQPSAQVSSGKFVINVERT